MSERFAATRVESAQLVRAWRSVRDRIPPCGFKEHGESVVALLNRRPPVVLEIDEKGSPSNVETEDFITAVDALHGALTMTSRSVKAFPFEYPPSTLEAKAEEFEKYSNRYPG